MRYEAEAVLRFDRPGYAYWRFVLRPALKVMTTGNCGVSSESADTIAEAIDFAKRATDKKRSDKDGCTR